MRKDRPKEPKWPEWSLARVRELLAKRKPKRLSIKLKIKANVVTAEAECREGQPRYLRRCASLGKRDEHRAGCGGWMCRHACNSTREDVAEHLGRILLAVPGDDCQDCPGFVDAGRF